MRLGAAAIILFLLLKILVLDSHIDAMKDAARGSAGASGQEHIRRRGDPFARAPLRRPGSTQTGRAAGAVPPGAETTTSGVSGMSAAGNTGARGPALPPTTGGAGVWNQLLGRLAEEQDAVAERTGGVVAADHPIQVPDPLPHDQDGAGGGAGLIGLESSDVGVEGAGTAQDTGGSNAGDGGSQPTVGALDGGVVWEGGDKAPSGAATAWEPDTAPATNGDTTAPSTAEAIEPPQEEAAPADAGHTNADGLAVNEHGMVAAEDLAYHQGHEHCWEHFDLGLLEQWKASEEVYCSPASGADEALATALRCRSFIDDHLPSATAPHTNCDADNLVVDFGVLRPTKCPVHRPEYKCDGPPYFWRYSEGALLGNCDRQPVFTLKKFPKDHLRDIFGGWAIGGKATDASLPLASAPVTIFITRERLEHANLFHASTDMINAMEALHMAGVIDIYNEGSRNGMENVQLVLLDEQPEGPFDETLQRVFSPNYPVLRVSDFQSQADRLVVRFPRAIFVHPGYTSFMFAALFQRGSCRYSLQLLQSYRLFFLRGLGIETPSPRPDDKLRLVFISRKPYDNFIEHKYMGRQISNEEEVVTMFRGIPNVEPQLVDFATISYTEQIELIVNTDIFVGMHGAALTHLVLLPPWAGVIELWPKTRDMWRCFEHLAEMTGHAYARWELRDQRMFHADKQGDYTRVVVNELRDIAEPMARGVRQRMAEFEAGTLGHK